MFEAIFPEFIFLTTLNTMYQLWTNFSFIYIFLRWLLKYKFLVTKRAQIVLIWKQFFLLLAVTWVSLQSQFLFIFVMICFKQHQHAVLGLRRVVCVHLEAFTKRNEGEMVQKVKDAWISKCNCLNKNFVWGNWLPLLFTYSGTGSILHLLQKV